MNKESAYPTSLLAISSTNHLLCGLSDGTILAWHEIEAKTVKKLSNAHANAITSLVALPDGCVASSAKEANIKVWSRDYEPARCLPNEPQVTQVNALAMLDKNNQLACATNDKDIHVIDSITGRVLQRWHGHEDAVVHVVAMRCDERAASSSLDRTIRIWNRHTAECLQFIEMPHATCAVSLVAFPNDFLAASCNGYMDHVVRLWYVDLNNLINIVTPAPGHDAAVGQLACLEMDSSLFVAAACGNRVKIWNLDHLDFCDDLVLSIHVPDGEVTCMTQMDEHLVAIGSADSLISVWDSVTKKILYKLDLV